MIPFDAALTYCFAYEWREWNRERRMVGDEYKERKGGCTHSHKGYLQMNRKTVRIHMVYVWRCVGACSASLLLCHVDVCCLHEYWPTCAVISICLYVSVLTAAGAVVLAALLWVAFKSTVKAVLPELCEPRVPVVVLGAKFKVVVIKPFHISRLELDGDPARCFSHITICHVIPVRPSITVKTNERHKERQATHEFTNSKSKQNVCQFFWISDEVVIILLTVKQMLFRKQNLRVFLIKFESRERRLRFVFLSNYFKWNSNNMFPWAQSNCVLWTLLLLLLLLLC